MRTMEYTRHNLASWLDNEDKKRSIRSYIVQNPYGLNPPTIPSSHLADMFIPHQFHMTAMHLAPLHCYAQNVGSHTPTTVDIHAPFHEAEYNMENAGN